jgi:hypothetical protein
VVGRAPRRRRPTRQRGGREYEAALGGVYPITESVDSHETQNIGAASESQAGQIGKRQGDRLRDKLAELPTLGGGLGVDT